MRRRKSDSCVSDWSVPTPTGRARERKRGKVRRSCTSKKETNDGEDREVRLKAWRWGQALAMLWPCGVVVAVGPMSSGSLWVCATVRENEQQKRKEDDGETFFVGSSFWLISALRALRKTKNSKRGGINHEKAKEEWEC